MIRKLIAWALDNPAIVLACCAVLIVFGIHSFKEVNVEAYPDPAPAIVEVVAQYPGASAEEVERQVTIPLEVTFGAMPKMTYLRTKSLFGLSHLRIQFEYGYDYLKARQEVINRLQFAQALPNGVAPQLSPQSPTGEIFRYTLNSPKDKSGRDIYNLNDLKALQDWTLEREFRRVPRVMDVTSRGGTVKRYELHIDLDKMKARGITLAQIQNALNNANTNVGADFIHQGQVALNVRAVGLIGGGLDPVNKVLGMKDPGITAQWTLTSSGTLSGGTFALQDSNPEGQTQGTAPIPYNATAAQIQAALALVLGQNNVLCTGGPIDISPVVVDYVGKLAGPHPNLNQNKNAVGLSVTNIRLAGKAPALSAVSTTVGMLGSEAAAEVAKAKKEGRADYAELREEQRRRMAMAASKIIRKEEEKRVLEIRKIVVTSINNAEILIEDLVEGGRLMPGEVVGVKGVVIGNQTRLGRSGLSVPDMEKASVIGREVDVRGKLLSRDEDDKVECVLLMRKGEDTLPALTAVRKKVEELNDPDGGRILPGVFMECYYDRADLIGVTTDTVQENLILGMVLVSVILLMFLSNIRGAIIVAINIPIALLFAFAMLYARGKSANLLSIGAVDFGIIVDSSVIMIENIYRKLSEGSQSDLPLKERILHACLEVEKPLFFSTAIIVCAFIPLFTMSGPEGQLFGPMADTYAFALGGALLLALTVSPVLSLLLFKHLKPSDDNGLVRWMKRGYLKQLERFLDYRWATVGVFAGLIGVTAVCIMPRLGREFMPELEEGNLWIRGTYPLNVSLDTVARDTKVARSIMGSSPEVETVVCELGRPDDGTDPTGFYNSEFFVPLKPESEWPATAEQTGWRRYLFGARRKRTKLELIDTMNKDLERDVPGVDWNFSQNIRDNVMEAISGVKGDNSLKIFGPDLKKLDEIAIKVKNRMRVIPGIENVGIFSIKGQTNVEFRINLDKCKKFGVGAGDVNNMLQAAIGAKAFSSMVEGERTFDISTRLALGKRRTVEDILDLPIDLVNNSVFTPQGPGWVPAAQGNNNVRPAVPGTLADTSNPITATPRLRLGDLVSPIGADNDVDESGRYERAGASTIYREQGTRMVPIKFSVRGRDLGSAVTDAKDKTLDLFEAPYRGEWGGEFQEMEEAEAKLMLIIPASLALIFMLLYVAFHSVIDACLVLVNVVALSLGGIWFLYFTDTNFSVSAAVGFVSIFGVAIMDGLLLVSYFNAMRSEGLPLREAIMQGAEKRVRPVMMTALTAIFGLLPAALATRIGSQTQKPLAIVVVGGMTTTLLMTRYLMPVLYSFYGHREPPTKSTMAH